SPSIDNGVITDLNGGVGNVFSYVNSPVTGTPGEQNGYYILSGEDILSGTNNYKAQLLLGTNDDAMYYRSDNGGSGTYGQWYHMASRDWVNNQGFIKTRNEWVFNETLSGTINGTNKIFTLANTPQTGKEMIFLNGVLLKEGAGNGYTISGKTVTMTKAPKDSTADSPADELRSTYLKN